MADQNVTISQDTVTVTGGQSTIDVDVNVGPKGDDGSVILYGQGKPQTLDPNEFPRTPRILDWYVNVDSTDDEYLFIYQLVYINNAGIWKRVFTITPNSYKTNKIVQFVDGIGQADVAVSNATIPLIPQFEFPTTGSVILPADDEDAMIALSTTPGTYAFRKDLAKYYYLREAPASVVSNWEGLITINTHVDIQNQFPVISSFQLGTPGIVQDPITSDVTYTLPIALVAYELTPLGPSPITGTRTAHISINVV